MEWATFGVIASAAAVLIYNHHPAYGFACLILLALNSKRGVIEDAVTKISEVVLSRGKWKLKIVRDVRGDLERLMAYPQIPGILKTDLLKVISKMHSIDLEPKKPALSNYITEEKAIEVVREVPEIQALAQQGIKLSFLIEGPEPYAVPGAEHPTYRIQVAQNLPDHLATVDWFHVDAVTGQLVANGANP